MSQPDDPEHRGDEPLEDADASTAGLNPKVTGWLAAVAPALANDEATEAAALHLGAEPEALEVAVREILGPDILDAAPLETFGAGLLAGLELGGERAALAERARLTQDADPEDLGWLLPLRDVGLVGRCVLLWVRALRAFSVLSDSEPLAPALRQRAALELQADAALLEETATAAEVAHLGARPRFADEAAAMAELLFAAHAAATLAAILGLAPMPAQDIDAPGPQALASIEALEEVFAADLGALEDLPSARGDSASALMLLVSGAQNLSSALGLPAEDPGRPGLVAAAEGRVRAAAWAVGLVQGEAGRRGDGFDADLPEEPIPVQVVVWQRSEWPGEAAPDSERFMACCRRALALSLSLEHLLVRRAVLGEDAYPTLAGEARTWARRASALAGAWALEPARVPQPAREALWICAAWLGAVAASADQATAARHGLTALPVAPLAARLQQAELAVWFLASADPGLHEAFDLLRAILPGRA